MCAQATPSIAWSTLVGGGATSSLSVGPPLPARDGNSTIYLGCYDGGVYALDSGRGDVVWRAATGASARF